MKIWRMVKESNFYQVKHHAGCFLNKMAAFMADEHAETGCLSDAEPICSGPTNAAHSALLH